MTGTTQPIVIKKYANRRLYDTGSSSYVTLEDLAGMVRKGRDFTVQDAKSGEDITRSVLGQIIFELEGRDEGGSLLPTDFLRQLIRFYGHSMQGMVPSYLEHSLRMFTHEQDALRRQMRDTVGRLPGVDVGLELMETQAKRNMEMFRKAMSLFLPPRGEQRTADEEPATQPESRSDEIRALKSELAELQAKIDRLR